MAEHGLVCKDGPSITGGAALRAATVALGWGLNAFLFATIVIFIRYYTKPVVVFYYPSK